MVTMFDGSSRGGSRFAIEPDAHLVAFDRRAEFDRDSRFDLGSRK